MNNLYKRNNEKLYYCKETLGNLTLQLIGLLLDPKINLSYNK